MFKTFLLLWLDSANNLKMSKFCFRPVELIKVRYRHEKFCNSVILNPYKM